MAVYLRQPQEMVVDAHARAAAFYGGLCERGVYANMKTAVDAVFVGKERRFNRRFAQMCSHYLVEPVAGTPASGWEKGQVKNQVGTVRQRLFTPRLRAKTLEEANERLRDAVIAWAQQTAHPEDKSRTVWEVFQSERPALITTSHPFDGFPFDGFHETTVSASKTCLIRFDRNLDSVAAVAAGKPVQVRADATRIVVWFNGAIVAEHPRAFGHGHTIDNPLHYLPVLVRKPGALRHGAPFRDWDLPAALARSIEPAADCERYDRLRAVREGCHGTA